MPSNKKKNKQKKKNVSGGNKASAADANLNAEVLESLRRLAETLAHLDEAHYDPVADGSVDAQAQAQEGNADEGNADDGFVELVNDTAAISLNDGKDKIVAESTTADNNATDAEAAGDDDDMASELNNKAAAASSEAVVASTSESNIAKSDDQPYYSSAEDDDDESATPHSEATANETTLTPPALPLSHWRTLPLQVLSAYGILNDGANYIHATSTKYTLVGKVDSKEGGNLAIELRKGAELVGTAALLLFSESCGSSRSLRRYVKKYSRALLASCISLVKSFEDGLAQGKANDGNNVGAQKTGAVWSACDNLTQKLPKGNRAAMRRELMVWVRDCNESIEEFEEILEMGPRDDDDDDDVGEEDRMDDDQYTEKEMKVAKASVNVMKCSKNLLGLVLETCECVGEHADKLSRLEEEEEQSADAQQEAATEVQDECEESVQQKHEADDSQRKEMLQYISNLHEMARTVGEGVTNVGILLYPPLEVAHNEEDYLQWQAKKPESTGVPSLGSTSLGLEFEHQLYALSECIMSVQDATLPISGNSVAGCLSVEVVSAADRLVKALKVRCKEVEEAVAVWDQ